MRFNGERVAVAGVSSVGTAPQKRRRGYLRRVMVQGLRDQRDRGQSLGVLYGSLAAIYQRFGYAVASAHYDYAIDPRDVRFASGPEPDGEVRVTGIEALPLLKEIYRTFATPRNGLIHRGETLWRDGPFADVDVRDGPVYAAIYEEGEEALGYAIYTNREWEFGDAAERTQLLTLREMAWLTPSAHIALWRHLGAHDLVYRIRARGMPEDDPLFHLLEEPRLLRRTMRDGVMWRVVDVEQALPQRPYGTAANLVFELDDPLCDWNCGVWELETDGPSATVRRSRRAAQLRLPVHSLSAMVSGFLSATALAEMGRVEVVDPTALIDWDRAFATRYRPHCMDNF
jgi:predicted acetyltransferase